MMDEVTNIFRKREAPPQDAPGSDYLDRAKRGAQELADWRAEQRQRYNVLVSDEEYEQMGKVIANAPNPEDESYKVALASQYSKWYGIPLSEAYANADVYTEAYMGRKFGEGDHKGAFEAVTDAFVMGNNTVRMGELGNLIRDAMTDGDTESLDVYLKEYKALAAENEARQDNTPRNIIVEALKAGAQSAPYTGRTAAASLFGSLAHPIVGAAVAWAYSSSIMQGQEFMDLLDDGADLDTASKVSAVSGALQGLVEATLGNVASVAGAGVKAVAGKTVSGIGGKTVGRIAEGVAKRFHFGAGKKLAVNLALGYAKETFEEGAEEAVQELVSIVARDVAAELGEYDIEPQAAGEIAGQVAEAFKGGMLGSLFLAGLPLAVNSTVGLKELRQVREQARTIESEEAFVAATKDSAVFTQYGDKADAAARNVWKSYQSARDERLRTETEERAEVTTAEGGVSEGEAAEVYRNDDGTLYTETEGDGDTGTFRAGTPEQAEGNTYGHIDYTVDEAAHSVTIDEFKMAEGRENIRAELYDNFAEAFAGYDIQWDAKGSVAKGIKADLEGANVSGTGLGWYKTAEGVADTRARVRIARELKQYMPQLNDRQRVAGVTLLEAMARGQGESVSSFVSRNFGASIFGDVREAEALAQAQGDTFQGKAGATAWRTFGNEVRAVIYAGERADFSTFAHELAHVYQRQMTGDIKARAEAAFGVVGGDWINSRYTFKDGTTQSAAEAFAYGFQDWLKTGKAPNEQMRSVFQRFAEFLADCLNALREHITLSKDITDTYAAMLEADDGILAEAERAVERQKRELKAKEEAEAARLERERRERAAAAEFDATEVTESEAAGVRTEVADEGAFDGESDAGGFPQEVEGIASPAMSEVEARRTAETIEDEDVTVAEKTEATLDAAGRIRDFETVVFQLVGTKAVKRIAREESRRRMESSLAFAEELEAKYLKQNLDARTVAARVKVATGWERDGDFNWIYETDDSGATVKNQAAIRELVRRKMEMRRGVVVGDILDYPELYEMYPEVRNFNVLLFNDRLAFRSMFTPNGIMLNLPYFTGMNGEKGLKASLLHEVQHWIAATERGATMDLYATRDLWNQAQRTMADPTAANVNTLNQLVRRVAEDESEYEPTLVARRIAMSLQERRRSLAFLNDTRIAFQIAGVEGAKNLDAAEESTRRIDGLHVAKEMEGAGKDALAIRLATGWEKGGDGLWRYELDSAESEVGLPGGEPGEAGLLPDFLSFPELYGAYPDLRRLAVRVEEMPKGTLGGYSPDENVIRMNAGLSGYEFHSTLLHEIQHWIQREEGFAVGGNPERFAEANRGRIAELEERRAEIEREIEGGDDANAEELQEIEVELQDLEDFRPFDDYRRLSGEVEARNVQKRQPYMTDERRRWLLAETADVAPEDQIVLFQMNEIQEDREIDDIRAEYMGTDGWMKAPNGRETNLSERQWLQVRTPSFKAWFGDWENDAANASVAVDENGEPKVVYHGSRSGGFSVFDDTAGYKQSGAPDGSMFFTSDRATARSYSGRNDAPTYEREYDETYPSIYECFLNIRDPQEEYFEGATWEGDLYGKAALFDENDEQVFTPTGNTFFDSKEAAEEYAQSIGLENYYLQEDPYVGTNTNQVASEAKSNGNDGAIIYDVVDNGGYFDNDPATDYVVFSSNQIKSATHNAGSFDLGDPSILFQKESASLLGVHNLSTENLRHALKMGGLANPSVAVVDTDLEEGFSKFGDISLIAPTSLLDKSTGRNAGIFGADIYSPRYPGVEVEVTAEGRKTLEGVFSSVKDARLQSALVTLACDAVGDGGDVARKSGLSVAYALEKGAEIESGEAYKANLEARRWIDGRGLGEDFTAWADGRLSAVEKTERLFAGFTPSGNRRYLPHTIDNVSRMMKGRGRRGAEGFYYGMGSARAVVAPRWTTTKQAAKHKHRIVEGSEFERAKEAIEGKFTKAAGILDGGGHGLLGEGRLVEALESGGDIAAFAEREYGLSLSEGEKTLLSSIRRDLEDLPTEYFEVKFERPVALSEFFAAVVPEDTPADLREALEDAGLEVREYAGGDRARVVSEYVRSRSESVRLLFQTEAELMGDAASFDTWEEFMEYYEAFGKPEDNIVPEGADAAWYRGVWELARGWKNPKTGAGLTPEQADERFLSELADPGVLEDFLTEADRAERTEPWQPSDEVEAAEVEAMAERRERVRRTMRHASWLTNARRVADGRELTAETRKRLLTLAKNAPRDYRALFAELMDRPEYAVADGETSAAEIKGRYRLSGGGDLENKSPEQRRRIARELSDADVARRIESGEMRMDAELQGYIDSLNREIRDARRRYEKLLKETEDDYARISEWEDRRLLELHDELTAARERADATTAEIRRKAERGIRVTERAQKEARGLRGTYDNIFRKFENLRKSMQLSRDVADAIKRREDLSALRARLADRQRNKRLAEREKRIRIQLVKRTMRRISFDTVDYGKGRAIIAAQRLLEPNLLGGVNRWIGTEGAYLRQVWSRWTTDADYRDGLRRRLSQSPAGRRAMKLLDDTDTVERYNAWTKKERELLHRVVPGEDWIRELKLEELAEERGKLRLDIKERREVSGGMERVTLTPGEGLRREVEDALGADLYALMSRPFAEWTTVEMERFAKRINDLYKEGRDELAAKNAVRRERAAEIRRTIEETVRDTGIEIDDDEPEESKRRKLEKINRILGRGDALRGTSADGRGSGIRARLLSLVRGYGGARLRSVARILDGQRDGVNVRELYVRENEAYNEKQRMIAERTAGVARVMRDNGIDLDDLFREVEISDFYNGRGATFTVDELLFFREAAKDEHSRAAVAYGNIGSMDALLDYKAECGAMDGADAARPGSRRFAAVCDGLLGKVLAEAEKLDEKYKAFATAVAEDYAEQYERMNRASIEEWNAPVNRVDNYVPLVRLESNGDTNENRVREDMLGVAGMGRAGVDKGMTKSRVDIGVLHQKPVETGLYKTWADSLERTEHFIAYSGYVRELNAVYRSRDAGYTRRLIEGRYGREMTRYIDSYIDETANPDAAGARSELDNFVRNLRGRTATGYLAWKMSSIIKQLATSPAPYLQFVSPAEYLSACLSVVTSGGRVLDGVKEKSPFMASRVMDVTVDLINEQLERNRGKAGYALAKFNKLGMKGLEAVDWICVAPGWVACYRRRLAELERAKEARFEERRAALEAANPAYGEEGHRTADEIDAEAGRILAEDSEREAVDFADDCTRLCQPSSRKADIAPFFKGGSEVAKALLQFQTSLNVIWNNIRYDLPFAVKNKQFGQAVGIVGGYVLAGVLVNMITDGLPEDDGDGERLRRLVWYGTTQFTDAIPVLGGEVTKTVEKMLTGRTQFLGGGSDIFPMVDKFLSAAQGASGGDWDKALDRTIEGFGLMTGLPVSGSKELLRAVADGPQALWGRRE